MNSRGSFIYTKSFPVKVPTPVAGFVNFITELHDSQKYNERVVVAIFIPVLQLFLMHLFSDDRISFLLINDWVNKTVKSTNSSSPV